jgi:hypothetical protein
MTATADASAVDASANAALIMMAKPLLRTDAHESWTGENADDGFAQRWHSMMSAPVPKGVQYRKALSRILAPDVPCMYHVAHYHDNSLFLDETVAQTVRAPLTTDEWRALVATNVLARCAVRAEPLRAPTHDEISSNIATHRAATNGKRGGGGSSDAGATSVPQAFKAALVSLATLVDAAHGEGALATACAARDEREALAEWARMLASHPTFGERCRARQAPSAEMWTFFVPMRTADDGLATEALARLLGGTTDAATRTAAWSHVDSLNNCATLSSSIPGGVMSKIESLASTLATDLRNGATDLHTLDLQSIGEQVLSQCDAGELTKLTENLGELMPVLGQMQATQGRGGALDHPMLGDALRNAGIALGRTG